MIAAVSCLAVPSMHDRFDERGHTALPHTHAHARACFTGNASCASRDNYYCYYSTSWPRTNHGRMASGLS
jgi:hypothetical protein